jgi:hypothetical protein
MSEPKYKRLLSHAALLLLLALTFCARMHNRQEVFHDDGRIYFIEGDCYSRMTRAKMVSEGQWVIRRHEFENAPIGTTPHTTAPMDWMIVALKGVCELGVRAADQQGTSALRSQTLDLAGALVSPLLAVTTAAWLWWWAGRMRLPYRAVMVLFFAISPILVHGTILGRPDHQSLLLLLIAVAVGAEFALAEFGMPARLARRWAWAAGIAWGLALWVSLYEPLLFFAGAVGRHVLFHPGALTARAVRGRWLAMGGVFVVALLVDGWRVSLPDSAMRPYLLAWSRTIGELGHLIPTDKTLWRWTGLFTLSGLVLLWHAARWDKRSFSVLLLIAVMLSLTIWQLRWGYFLALAVAISIPWQLGALRNLWAGWLGAAAALAPIVLGWPAILHPTDKQREDREFARAAQDEWRRLAEFVRGPERMPFIAPWWVSPQLAYWSGQPGVAGTSHQSLPGIVETARFYTASAGDGGKLLRERGVRIVFVDDSSRTRGNSGEFAAVGNSRRILGLDRLPPEPLGQLLAESPRQAPAYLRLVTPRERGLVVEVSHGTPEDPATPATEFYKPQYHQVFIVEPEKLQAP